MRGRSWGATWPRPLFCLTAAVAMAACHGGNDYGRCGTPKITASPAGGLFPEDSDQRITLATNLDATVYFTLDGTVPDRETSHCALGPTFCGAAPVRNIPVAYDGMTLQYFAVDRCGNESAVASSTYRLDRAPVTVADPPPGLFNAAQTVKLVASDEATAPATIYYTRDGSDPDPASPNVESGASPVLDIAISRSTQLKWRAKDSSGNLEEIRSGQYVIDTVLPTSSADPAGGNYDDTVDVTIRIDNDTGALYYTTNGGVPKKNDPQGHTRVASLQAQLTIETSTFLRFTSIDKAGNYEHGATDATPYNEEVYVIDDVPAVIATPPGGEYSETELAVVLDAFPLTADITYSLNDGPTLAYTRGDAIALSGFEVKLEVTADDPLDVVPPRTIVENYVLGVAGESETVVEDFTTTDALDLDATTADIDTAGGRAVLGNVPVVRESAVTTAAAQPADVPGTDFLHRVAVETPGLGAGTVAVIDGNVAGGGGIDDAGLKLFTWGGDDPTDLTFVGTHNDGAPYTALALVRPVAPYTDLVAVATSVDGNLYAIDASNAGDLDTLPLITAGSLAPPAVVAQVTQPVNAMFVTRRSPTTFINEIVAVTMPAAALVEAGTLTVTTGGLDEIVGLALDPVDETIVWALTESCDLYRVDYGDLLNPVLTGGSAWVDNVCGAGVARVTALRVARLDGTVTYAFVAFLDTAGIANLSAVPIDVAGDNPAAAVIAAIEAPTDEIWSLVPLFLGDPTNRAIALASGDELLIVDLTGIAAWFSGTSATIVQRRSDDDGYELDAVAPAAFLNPLEVDAVLAGVGWSLDNPPGNGMISTWRVPANFRDKQPSAVVQSGNVNPLAGRQLRSVKFEDNDFDGDVSFAISSDGNSFAAIECCQTVAIDPPADSFFWRATLTDDEGDDVELRRVEFRLDYAE